MPNVVINNTTNNKTLTLSANGFVYGNFTILIGTALKLGEVWDTGEQGGLERVGGI